MPIFALLRNLRNILQYAPDKVEEACRQLTIKDKERNANRGVERKVFDQITGQSRGYDEIIEAVEAIIL